jgi:hypothetical protein
MEYRIIKKNYIILYCLVIHILWFFSTKEFSKIKKNIFILHRETIHLKFCEPAQFIKIICILLIQQQQKKIG